LVIKLERIKDENNVEKILEIIADKIGEGLGKKFTNINTQNNFQEIFKKGVLNKPLILILDEFDSLNENAINTLTSSFRSIYIDRTYGIEKNTGEKPYLLHSVALIGVRSVLGIENQKGSFQCPAQVHIPNLTLQKWKECSNGMNRKAAKKIGMKR
jgi:hypothetical protein